MALIKVFYDFHDEAIKPMTMVIRFRHGEMKWDEPAFYVPLQAPFKRHRTEDYYPETFGLAVHLEDLMIRPDKPSAFGINLERIMQRYKLEIPDEEVNFIVRLADIEDVMQMSIQSNYEWR